MVIAEPVQNGRGALVPPPGYWPGLRQICDRYGILLCADEVINGFGRVGSWFGSERVGVVPDLITFAKGVTSAYVPLAGLIASERLVEAVAASEPGTFVHGSTFGGHPVATAVALANIAALRDEKVLGNVVAHEEMLRAGLAELGERHDVVGDTRGAGYLHAIELVASRERGTALAPEQVATLLGGGLQRCLLEAGVSTRPDDRGGVCIMVSPPLVCGRRELEDLLGRLDDALRRVGSLLGGTPGDGSTDG
jgi:adenosylmethionine-8-amino-7-oxononanoate aminotransferase